VRFVCAKCGSDCREPRAQYDDEGRPFLIWTVCAYCDRSELSLEPNEGNDKVRETRSLSKKAA
jgi:hypothetical protein